MLYDPNWQKPKVQADVFLLESLIAWLEKQNPETEYDYCWGDNCVIAQYLKSQGIKDGYVDPAELRRLGWKHIAQDLTGSPQKWTFGAALARAGDVEDGNG